MGTLIPSNRPIMRRLLFHRLKVMLALSICLMSCGGEEGKIDEEPFIVVESDIPGMYFEVPEGALPTGFDPADIKITPLPSPADPTTSKDGVQTQAWKLTPDGARFEKPIRLVIPFEQSIPFIFHQYEDEIELVSGVHYKMTAEGNTASVPLNHFSVVVTSSQHRGSIFDISGGAADTLIEEPIDVQVVFRMNSDYLEFSRERSPPDFSDFSPSTQAEADQIFEELYGGEPIRIRLYVAPHGREACPNRLPGCFIWTYSQNIRPNQHLGISPAGMKELEPDPRIFDDQFTLHSDDLICKSAGSGVLKASAAIEWLFGTFDCNQEGCLNTGGYDTNILAGFELDIPVNCVEDKINVEVVSFEQKVSTYAFSSEAAVNVFHQSSQVQEYQWSPLAGDGVIVTTSTKDSVETSKSSQGGLYHNQSLSQKASVPAGVSALAEITTQTQHNQLEFSVAGELSLDAHGMDDMEPKQWGAQGTASADWSMMVSIRQASIIQIENCDLFNQMTWEEYPDFKREAGNCSFKIAGSTMIELPGSLVLPEVTLDPTTVTIDDEHVESKRLLDLMTGQNVMFLLSVDHTEMVSFSPSGPENARKEKFSIRIRPALEEEERQRQEEFSVEEERQRQEELRVEEERQRQEELRVEEERRRQAVLSKKSFCANYANSAVNQQKKNLNKNCGFGGDRWSTEYDGHYNWCLDETVPESMAVSEEDQRDQRLLECDKRPQTYLDNTNLLEGDIGPTIGFSPLDCERACAENSKCLAWTWVKQDALVEIIPRLFNIPRCVLKDSRDLQRLTHPCCVSGLKP